MQITAENYFHNYIINAFSKDLTKAQQAFVFLSSLFLGFVTLGIAHAVACCLKDRKVVQLPVPKRPQPQPEPAPALAPASTPQPEPVVEVKKPLTFDEEVAAFCSRYEKKFLSAPKEEGVLRATYARGGTAVLACAEADLKEYLRDMTSYKAAQDKIIDLVYTALIKDPMQGHVIYKMLSEFYQKHLMADLVVRERLKPSAYLQDHLMGQEHFKQDAIYFLLKQLRKQILLKKEQGKIKQLAQEAFKDNPKLDDALKYLSINWAHGTKLVTLKSACENTDKTLLPTGELTRRKVDLLCGELIRGVNPLGINQTDLSGVNLAWSNLALDYAKGYGYNPDAELQIYNRQKGTTFKIKDDLNRETKDEFTRFITALKRVKESKPDIFKQDLLFFKSQREQMRNFLKEVMFKDIDKATDYESNILYAFLKAFEKFEKLLVEDAPPVKAQDMELANKPLIVATSTKYTIPFTHTVYREPSEETIPGSLKLGQDIQTLFVRPEDRAITEKMVADYQLQGVKVEDLEVFELAAEIDRKLAPFLYDVYNLKKWESGE